MGRPTTADHPVVTVRHVDTGATIAWSDGHFAGDRNLTARARILATLTPDDNPNTVRIGMDNLTAGFDTPEHAAAAMLAACGGRGIIIEPDTLKLPTGGCVNVDDDVLDLTGDDTANKAG